jgi:membrane protein required for colicin V production
MEISYFDLVVASVILLLGLKGILNGFFKEIFGLIGIIGGIFIASRVGEPFGEYLNTLIFHFEAASAVSFVGFLLALGLFWILMVLIGFLFKRLSNISGLGPVDRVFGFLFGAGKFFLIAAIIAHALYSVKAIHTAIGTKLEGSTLFPILVETGSIIMKIDPTQMTQDLNTTLETQTQTLKEQTDQVMQNAAKVEIEKIKTTIEQNITKEQ